MDGRNKGMWAKARAKLEAKCEGYDGSHTDLAHYGPHRPGLSSMAHAVDGIEALGSEVTDGR